MKRHRLLFQEEFWPDITAGKKTATIRLSAAPFRPDETVAVAKTRYSRYEEAPMFLKIKGIQRLLFRDITDGHLSKTGVTRDWYRKRYKDRLNDFTEVTYIEFEVVA